MRELDLGICRADSLEPGDMVDLEGDKYADPDREHPWLEYELATVVEVVRETPECVCVYFEGLAVGFPVAHVLAFVRPVPEVQP